MKKLTFVGLTILSTAILTACGGGGGSSPATPMVNSGTSGSSSNSPVNVGNVSNGSNTSSSSNNTNTKVDTSIAGNQINLNNTTKNTVNLTKTTATSDKNIVVVNGQNITFTPTGMSSGTTYNIQDAIINGVKLTRVGGGDRQLQYTRYGYVKEGSNSPFLFAQGHLTSDMPKTGSAIYQGNAAHVENGVVNIKDATFNVNYATGNITGQISSTTGSTTNTTLSAKISGNSFSGSVGTGLNKVTTTGQFYGPQAAEMGGVYQNERGNMSGAFGAKK